MTDYADQLLDFMYVDRPKVASFLAQFLSEGLVEREETTRETSGSRSGSVGLPSAKILSLLGISAAGERTSANATSEKLMKNPEWAQAKALVQYVDDAQAQTSYSGSSIGTLQIVSGNLSIYDLTPFRKAASNRSLMDAAVEFVSNNPSFFFEEIKEIDRKIGELEDSKSRNRDTSKINSDIKKLKDKRKDRLENSPNFGRLLAEGIAEFARQAPFSIIAMLQSEEDIYWFTLREESLLHTQGDTILKYGFDIEGKWSVACVVDGEDNSSKEHKLTDFGDFGLSQLPVYDMVRGVVTVSRNLAGRPSSFRSLMPLVVYRSLGPLLR
ncbi:hypothetical protein FJU11_04460 [Pararhizobium mangrovi]|uniref:Uncharacterized protein n=2 Tax=Pararhizobium mangrovi TaxID=2590452 RepID=A0A506U8D6_9HYPH|nr:hypothetical protein FJU11_04460 [Pararhizobium mangrovi]